MLRPERAKPRQGRCAVLKRLLEMPNGIDGLRAEGKVTKDDYEEVIRPLLHDARRDGRRIRLLYEFAPDFEGFTAGAAWQDARIGLQYLRLFERVAVVSKVAWIRESAHLVGAMLPCPVRVFPERDGALDWLGARITWHLSHRLVPESGVLVVEPVGPLRPEDFDAVSLVVDPWIESHGALHGLVVHMREFPGWESVGGFVRHVQFVREHHKRVRRVALAADSPMAQLMPKLAEHFLKAELKHFSYDQLDQAIAWAGT
jgi:hypothetical protein